jgi:short-subunit dehydrogenase
MKLAIVTGASSGIGAAASRHLARQNYKVILVARRQSELEKIASDIGANAVAEPCDVSRGADVLALAEKIKKQHGIPDAIINCAGAGEWKFIEDTPPEEAVAMMAAPYLAAYNMSHAFMREMLERQAGVLIHVNSPASLFPWPSATGYTAARWALRGLHESLCQDLHGSGVHSCHLVVSRVDSPYFEHNKNLETKIPGVSKLARTLSPDECGRLIAKLVQHPRKQVLHPLMLRFFGWLSRMCAPLALYFLRVTSPQNNHHRRK